MNDRVRYECDRAAIEMSDRCAGSGPCGAREDALGVTRETLRATMSGDHAALSCPSIYF